MSERNSTLHTGKVFQETWEPSLLKCKLQETEVTLTLEELEVLVPYFRKSITNGDIDILVLTINVPAVYNDTKAFLESLGITVNSPITYIRFEDDDALQFILEKASLDGIGVTAEDLARLLPSNYPTSNTYGVFNASNKKVKYFNEFKYFTSFTGKSFLFIYMSSLEELSFPQEFRLSYTNSTSGSFVGVTRLKKITVPNLEWIFTLNKNASAFRAYDCPTYNNSAIYYDYDGNSLVGEIQVPTTITKVLPSTFYHYLHLTKFIGHSGITSLGESALSYTYNLEEVDVSMTSIDTINHNLCLDCTKLTSFKVPNTVTKIESSAGRSGAFANTSLTSFSAENVLTIGTHTEGYTNQYCGAFSRCTHLASINFPKVTTLGPSVFYTNKALSSVNMPELTYIGQYAFANCTSLTGINSSKILYVGLGAFYGDTALESISLDPTNTEYIGAYAFYTCSNFAIDSLPTNLTTLGGFAFYQTKVTIDKIPDNITNLSSGVFTGCNQITSMNLNNVETASTPSNVAYGPLRGCKNMLTLLAPKLTTTVLGMFAGCTSLLTITLPEVTSLAASAFYSDSQLVSANLPKVTTIGNSAFGLCTNLTTLNAPLLEVIDHLAFYQCTSLHFNTQMLAKVTSINGLSTFNGCTFDKLTTLPDTVTSLSGYYNNVGLFTGARGYLHLGKVQTLLMDTILSSSLTTLIIPLSVTSVSFTSGNAINFGYCISNLTYFIWEEGTVLLSIGSSTTLLCWTGLNRKLRDFPSNVSIEKFNQWTYSTAYRVNTLILRALSPNTITSPNTGRPYYIFVPEGSLDAYKATLGETSVYAIGSPTWVTKMLEFAEEYQWEAPEGYDWTDPYVDYDIFGADKPEKDENGVYKTMANGNLDAE